MGDLAKRPDGFRRRIPHLGVRAGKSHLINGLIDLFDWPLDIKFGLKFDHAAPRQRSATPSECPSILRNKPSCRKLVIAARADLRARS